MGRAARVLLVEDEAGTREAVAEMLEDAGHSVIATCSGDEAAILLAEDAGFDLLLTDVVMPGHIDGIGLAAHAREVHAGLPVIFMSGCPATMPRSLAVAQPTVFLSKPGDLAKLPDTVGRLVDAS